jgi:hypothetical protein
MEERKLEYRETADFKVIENTLLLVGKLSDTRDKVKAMGILKDAFAKELGAVSDKLVYDVPNEGDEPEVFVKFVNPKDEGSLYPHLAVLLKEAVLKKCRQDRKERVLSYIDAFMKMWEEGRNNQASQERHKRPQEATNGHTPTITPQEQKTAAEPKELKDLLPERLRNDEALKIFQRAIDANLIEKTATGLKWQLSNALLAYLCGIVYCGDTSPWDEYYKEYIVKKRRSKFFPDKALSELFGVKNLGQSRLQLIYKPRGYEKVDVLFKG